MFIMASSICEAAEKETVLQRRFTLSQNHTAELTTCCVKWDNGKQEPRQIIKKTSNDR